MGERSSWRDNFVALGQSLFEVVRAELAVIREAWAGSMRQLAIAVGMFAVAGYIALVCLPPLLIFALVHGLHQGLGWPLWATALVVAALVALCIYLIVRLASKRLRERFESPVATVKERVADHTAWWNDSLLNAPGSDAGATSLKEDNPTAGAKGGANEAPEGQSGQDQADDRSAGDEPSGV